MRLAESFGAAVVENKFVGRIEADAPHNVAQLCSINHSIATVPEVEQIEHVSYVYWRKTTRTT